MEALKHAVVYEDENDMQNRWRPSRSVKFLFLLGKMNKIWGEKAKWTRGKITQCYLIPTYLFLKWKDIMEICKRLILEFLNWCIKKDS